MKKITCEDIEQILVDYSDGILEQADEDLVSRHLDECENCRKLFQALKRSLELSNVIWENNLSEIENIAIPNSKKTTKSHWLRYASIAASILIILTTVILWHSSSKPKEPVVQLSFEEIEKNINNSAEAARLLAATELLEEYPDYKEIVENQYRYIAKVYPGTPAAEKIKLKIQ